MPYNGPSDDAPSGSGPFGNAAASTAVQDAGAAADVTAAVAAVALEVAGMRRALLGSDKALIDHCMLRLEQAALAFRDGFQGAVQKHSVIHDPTKLRRDLVALRGNLAVVAGLAQSGSALYQGLARLLGAAAGGYTPRGDGAPLQPPVSVLVRG
jgi:hypothetical protein